jgi:CelD/BcsL family acetyltransferase involved in cellulose biosynthesis
MDAVMKTSSDARPESVKSRSHGLSSKAEYRRLCETEPSIPLFSTDWWLDAAVGSDNWEVVLMKANGTIVGAMPFAPARRFGMDVIEQPPLTPVLGPWIRQNGATASARLSNEQKIMQSLIEQLPRFDHFRQTWNKSLSNWLPFYWNGYSQTTEYTYVIPALHDLGALWSEFDSSRRKHCKSGVERHKLRVREDLPVDALLDLHKLTLENRGVIQSFSDECLLRIDAACGRRKRRKILVAVDEAGRHCAATYTVWDSHCAYALIKGADPDMRHTRAPSVCQWESIKFSATVAPQYDFLGNMNPSIEPYVRSFATKQTPVFTVSKTPSRLLRLRQGLMSALVRGR